MEKTYTQEPPLNDIEDALLLLPMYKPGEISFVRRATLAPGGNVRVHLPYRAMNDLNSYSHLEFGTDPDDCLLWTAFAARIRESRSWSSEWFAAARRFFLCGGAKQFKRDDVDRVLDYATALEATLVPERDYSARRIRHRAAELLDPGNPAEKSATVKFINKFYDIRSTIVHGSRLSEESMDWLIENHAQLELKVRRILLTAVRKLPPGKEDRQRVLAGLYDPTDEDRGNFVLERFNGIKTAEAKKAVAARIAELVGEWSNAASLATASPSRSASDRPHKPRTSRQQIFRCLAAHRGIPSK